MRLLHARFPDDGARAAHAGAEREQGKNPPRALRKSLPLHGLYQHHRSRLRSALRVRREQPEMTAKAAFVGTAVERIEDLRLLRGEGRYVDDLHASGMLHAAIVRS